MTLRESQEENLLAHAPAELTVARLRRLGEGIGKVVYASDHWVVKRERGPTEIVALIAIWRILRRLEHLLPGGIGRRLLSKPSRQIRLLRVALQGILFLIPQSVWLSSHLGAMWRVYRRRDLRGDLIAATRGDPTGLPRRVQFPPTRVRIGGWPGWLTVTEATERAESTLYQRLSDLSAARRFGEVEQLLNRFLDMRQRGWAAGIFSMDSHLKNYGVIGDRVVLIDTGGLTVDWKEIAGRLEFEEVLVEPHIQLGLGPILGGCPDVAARFNARWKQCVNRDEVGRLFASSTH